LYTPGLDLVYLRVKRMRSTWGVVSPWKRCRG